MKKDNLTTTNEHTSREAWLRAGKVELTPIFAKHGYTLPDDMRFAIAFTSGGKRGMEGECWHPHASADHHYEIIIKADNDDPIIILSILFHELIHTLLPPRVKHGKEFRDIALRLGLEGKMAHTAPTPLLRDHLAAVAATLGPLPHAKLTCMPTDIDGFNKADGPKRQGVRMLKAECIAPACGYTVRIIPKWAKVGLPICPAHPDHGQLTCDIPEEDAPSIPATPLQINKPDVAPLVTAAPDEQFAAVDHEQ